MSFINIEIKARTARTSEIRAFLRANNAEFKGMDEQVDTYFQVQNGRLKLRQGNIENNLIYYDRRDQLGPKQSDCELMKIEKADALREMLSKAIGIQVVVKKKREIYYIANVKFHLDSLEDLGNFVEIEASNKNHSIETARLYEQCDFYMKEFGIKQEDLIEQSYSDMLCDKNQEPIPKLLDK